MNSPPRFVHYLPPGIFKKESGYPQVANYGNAYNVFLNSTSPTKAPNLKMRKIASTTESLQESDGVAQDVTHANSINYAKWPGVTRNWQSISRTVKKTDTCGRLQSEKATPICFKLASYNILCQRSMFENFHLYKRNIPPECTEEWTSWDFRWRNLKQELIELDCDVFCFQEIQEDQYKADIEPFLNSRGFCGIYQRRPGNKCDGCAIAYRSSVFTLEATKRVNYYTPLTYLDRDNVGIVAVLKSSLHPKSNERLVIATTHLLFNPKRGDIKLAQLAMLLANTEKAAYRGKDTKGRSLYHPVILCGDLNVEPGSPIYEFVLRKHLRYEGQWTAALSGQGKVGGGVLGRYLIPASLEVTRSCQLVQSVKERTNLSAVPPDPFVLHDGNNSAASSTTAALPPVIDISQEDDDVIAIETSYVEEVAQTASSSAGIDGLTFLQRFASGSITIRHPAQALDSTCLSEETGVLTHPFEFASVYVHVKENGEKELTSYHADQSNVDYIFYSVQKKELKSRKRGSAPSQQITERIDLKCLQRLVLPTVAQFRNLIGPLPNDKLSSDHVVIAAQFEWTSA